MKYILPVTLALILTSCGSEEDATEDKKDSTSQTQEDTVTVEEAFISTADFVKNNKEFKLLKPDMDYFNQKEGFVDSWGYTYLKKYYLATNKKQSVEYDEWDSTYICSF